MKKLLKTLAVVFTLVVCCLVGACGGAKQDIGLSAPGEVVLYEGYSDTKTDAFTVTGKGVGVTLASDYDRITWNEQESALEIASGLTAGEYSVSLTANAKNARKPQTVSYKITVLEYVRPSISGPQSVELYEGYAALSTEAYTVSGTNAAVTASGSNLNGKIVWNNETKKLDIAEGLASGNYLVTVVAANDRPQDTASVEVRIKVRAYPAIEGGSELTVFSGYEATSTDPFTVKGSNVTVEITQNEAQDKITWNDQTKSLDVAAGLVVGTYRVTLKVSDGNPAHDNTFEFTFTVAAQKHIDMYLVAGQSNAAGYSNKGNLAESFENVLYAGQINRSIKNGTTYSDLLTIDETRVVTSGFGWKADFVGPEYGMAKLLNDYYNQEHMAMIFKSAAGGTHLNDYAGGESANFGNWYPRSKWESGYVPEITGTTSDPTGVQYALFVENFKTVYNGLKAQGYDPAVKGMVWMQGESDLDTPAAYEELLKALIDDLRADLFAVTNDESVKTLPFAVGEIATTFKAYNNAKVPPFNEMQRRVAASYTDGSVKTVATSDLVIVKEGGVINGTDRSHFNTGDALTLGARFANALMSYDDTRFPAAAMQTVTGSYAYARSVGANDTVEVNVNGVAATVDRVNCTYTANVYKTETVAVQIKGAYFTDVVKSDAALTENAVERLSFTATPNMGGGGVTYSANGFTIPNNDNGKNFHNWITAREGFVVSFTLGATANSSRWFNRGGFYTKIGDTYCTITFRITGGKVVILLDEATYSEKTESANITTDYACANDEELPVTVAYLQGTYYIFFNGQFIVDIDSVEDVPSSYRQYLTAKFFEQGERTLGFRALEVSSTFTDIDWALGNAATTAALEELLARISGEEAMTLPLGYGATESAAFALNAFGNYTVTVTGDTGDGKIVWNETNKTLNIAAGLEEGEYVVTLTLINGGTEKEFTFTLNVIDIPMHAVTGSYTYASGTYAGGKITNAGDTVTVASGTFKGTVDAAAQTYSITIPEGENVITLASAMFCDVSTTVTVSEACDAGSVAFTVPKLGDGANATKLENGYTVNASQNAALVGASASEGFVVGFTLGGSSSNEWFYRGMLGVTMQGGGANHAITFRAMEGGDLRVTLGTLSGILSSNFSKALSGVAESRTADLEVTIVYYKNAYYVVLNGEPACKIAEKQDFTNDAYNYNAAFFAAGTRSLSLKTGNVSGTFKNISYKLGNEAAEELIKEKLLSVCPFSVAGDPSVVSDSGEVLLIEGYADARLKPITVVSSFDYTVTLAEGADEKIRWDETDQCLIVGAGLAIGDYTVTLNVTNVFGQTGSYTVTLKVEQVPTVTITGSYSYTSGTYAGGKLTNADDEVKVTCGVIEGTVDTAEQTYSIEVPQGASGAEIQLVFTSNFFRNATVTVSSEQSGQASEVQFTVPKLAQSAKVTEVDRGYKFEANVKGVKATKATASAGVGNAVRVLGATASEGFVFTWTNDGGLAGSSLFDRAYLGIQVEGGINHAISFMSNASNQLEIVFHQTFGLDSGNAGRRDVSRQAVYTLGKTTAATVSIVYYEQAYYVIVNNEYVVNLACASFMNIQTTWGFRNSGDATKLDPSMYESGVRSLYLMTYNKGSTVTDISYRLGNDAAKEALEGKTFEVEGETTVNLTAGYSAKTVALTVAEPSWVTSYTAVVMSDVTANEDIYKSHGGKITWNAETKEVAIAEGLAAGRYLLRVNLSVTGVGSGYELRDKYIQVLTVRINVT